MRIALLVLCALANLIVSAEEPVSASLRGKVLCGYQGWFRCAGDSVNEGWIHWSRDSHRLSPETTTFDIWPDVHELPPHARYPAGEFLHADGQAAELFSSNDAATVQKHFEWMRTYGIDGVWLQHFAVDLPGGPMASRYESRSRVLQHVRRASRETGRVWAIAFDLAGLPADKIVPTVTTEWKKLVDSGVTSEPHYVKESGKPVVQIWGFYFRNSNNRITPEQGNQLVEFFKTPGPYAAFLVGGGDWDWRQNPDPQWQSLFRRFDGYSPWNVGNVTRGPNGTLHATTSYWKEDKAECDRNGMLWLPVIYPGFSWDNLQQKSPGSTNIPRRRGQFLWEQFHALGETGVDSVCVAMFDEVDEGTAIFKLLDQPPKPGHFLGLEGMPSDWYLRLVGEGTRRLRSKDVTTQIPLLP